MAQVDSKTNDVRTVVDGKDYYRHKVVKGEGLYRLSKNYNVSQEDIIKANPGMTEILSEGQLVLIPVAAPVVHPDKQVANPNFIYHKVVAKETVYGISSKYGITADELLKLNPGLAEQGLQMGAVLRIPRDKIVEKPIVQEPQKESTIGYKAVTFYTLDNGETFFALTRKLGITKDELLDVNPGLNPDNVPAGWVLVIPEKVKNNPNAGELFITHKIAKKETLFGISKKYGVDSNVIKQFNPNVNFSSLDKGQSLIIPTTKWFDNYSIVQSQLKEQAAEKAAVIVKNDCNGYNYQASNDIIKVAVLLPFNAVSGINEMVTDSTAVTNDVIVTSSEGDPKAFSGKSKLMLEFYEGFLMGLDKFRQQGVNMEITTYDTGLDNSDISKVLQKPGVANANMIVGPGNPEHMKVVADFASKHQIKLINPFSAGEEEVANNPGIFQVTAIDSFFVEKACATLLEKAQDGQLVIIRSAAGNNAAENRIIDVLKRKMAALKMDAGSLTEIAFSKGNIYAISDRLNKERTNYIFVPSDNEVFVNHVTISLSAIVERGTHQLEVYGMTDWLRFQSIDPELIHKLNGRIFSYYGVDYQLDVTRKFLTGYRALYQTEPYAFAPNFQRPMNNAGYSRYGIWGYDIATFFIGAYVNYGPHFETCIGKMKSDELIQSNFKFKRISNWGGFYNNGLMILKFNRDFSIQRELVD
jgi:LysM repeat protein